MRCETPRNTDQAITGKGLNRAVEVILALAGLILLFPFLAVAALAVALSSRGPILFRQERVGKRGKVFVMLKLRTMRGCISGPFVTARDDARITAIGRLLRVAKLDEVPQLWNVVKGDMSLVGPRPEVPKLVDFDDPAWQIVLSVRPGITCPVTIRLRDEESLLALIDGDRETVYQKRLLPYKLDHYKLYIITRSPWRDLVILAATVGAIIFRERESSIEIDWLNADHKTGSKLADRKGSHRKIGRR